jgi:hypothetical protein
VVDMPLLFEAGFDLYCAETLLIHVDPATQIARLVARDSCSADLARAKIASQMPLAAKKSRATLVVENEGDVAELLEKARGVAGDIKRRSGAVSTLLWSPYVVGAALWALGRWALGAAAAAATGKGRAGRRRAVS